MFHKKNKNAFTLVEILIGILIVSSVMISGFQALTAIWIWKIRLIEDTQTQKQALYFSEKLFEMIKYGGTIDYEEYFARKVRNNFNIWTNAFPWSPYLSGHYQQSTWFGNFSISWLVGTLNYKLPPIPTNTADFYYCTSSGWVAMWTDWCYSNFLSTGNPQTYGQYSFQFRDYNSNLDWDTHCTTPIVWDQDCDGNIIWDDDDEYLGAWPDVFPLWKDTKELYLINWVKRERTFFRYNVDLDEYRPNWSTCTTSDDGASYTGSGCIWTIEYLKLEWRDRGLDHINWTSDNTEFDWVIDTWLISTQFTGWTEIIAWTYLDSNKYWQKLFPDDINVTEFKVFPHPNKDTDRAWKEASNEQNVAESVRIQLWMMPARKNRKKFKWTPKEYKYNTTINLTDIFTR